MPSSHYYRPVDPGYGAIGQALGQGLSQGVQNYQGQVNSGIQRQQVAQQQQLDAEQQAQLAAYRDAQLAIQRQNAARLETQAAEQSAARGFFGPEQAGPIAEAYNLQQVPFGDRVMLPGYSQAVEAAHEPAELNYGAAALDIVNRVTGGQRALNRERDVPAIQAAIEESGLIQQGYDPMRLMSAAFSGAGGLRSEPRPEEGTSIQEVAQGLVENIARTNPAVFETPEDFINWTIGQEREGVMLGGEGQKLIQQEARMAGVNPRELTKWISYYAGIAPSPPSTTVNPQR